MKEKIPEPPSEVPETPERTSAIERLHAVNLNLVADWCGRPDERNSSRAALLQAAIEKHADTQSIERISDYLQWFLANEVVRRDCESGFYSPEED